MRRPAHPWTLLRVNAHSPLLGDTPALLVTARRRPCRACVRRVRVTLFSPSVFLIGNISAGLSNGFHGTNLPGSDGQCCIRCTRGLREERG